MTASVNDKFRRATDSTGALPANLASPKAAGATTATLTVATGWPTSTGVDVVMYLIDTSGTKVPGSQTAWVATLAGTTLSGMALQQGTEPSTGYPGTDRTIVTVRPTAAWNKALVDGLTAQHKQDGSHSNITADSVTTGGYLQASGSFAVPNNVITAPMLATSAITLGYAQTVAAFSTANASATQVTGLSASVTIPAGGRKVKITCFLYEMYNSTAGASVLLSIWDGTVNSGTEIATAGFTSVSANAVAPGTCIAVVTPAAGAKTYNIGLQAVGGGTANVAATSTAPGFILVEAI